jgi:ADP-ribose pyrophosphatase
VAAWKQYSTRLVYRGATGFEVHEDLLETPRGRTLTYTRLEGRSFACVVPVSDEGKIVFVRNYRPPVRASLLELPGGAIDRGEAPRAAARRELEEETGYHAGELRSIGWYFPLPARMNVRGHIFLGRKLHPGTPHQDATEDIRTVELPVGAAYDRLRRGTFRNASTMIGLWLAKPILQGESLSPVAAST